VGAVAGSNFCDIGWQVRDGSVAVMTALDNLVKGMAGQAIQNMNLALGFSETEGLMQPGTYPG
jgi:N-acetyl-gamma-glutamyl-phosphate reductase